MRYNHPVTAKEDLRDEVERLTEQETARWLQRLRTRRSRPILREGALSTLPRHERSEALRAMFEEWEAEGGYMTDQEWEKFAREFDSHRPHRPLFT